MGYSEILSTIAIVVSVGSFSVAVTNVFRDRPRVKITSTFFEGSGYDPEPRIQIVVVNKGRRPVILRMFGGTDADGKWSAQFLEYEKGGIRLEENGRWQYSVAKQGTFSFVPDGADIIYDWLWIEDSLGKRYPIPFSQQHIESLRGERSA